ncbi:MAG: hypothetical protein XD78_1903 [Desulfotomaculum sp. 46_296]|nr:MAG: hypothetical protein XD78_1903 [Desulfotomaculum sp. 46_296]
MPVKEPVQKINGKICFTTTAMCEALNVSRETLSVWESKGCPKTARGWWPLWDILRWRGLIPLAGNQEGQAEEPLAVKRLRYDASLKEAKVEEITFKNEATQKMYVSKEEATAEIRRFYPVLKKSVLTFCRRIVAEVEPYVDRAVVKRVEKIITELTLDALGQISVPGVFTAPKRKQKKGGN